MKSYNGKIKTVSTESEEAGDRNVVLLLISQIDREIEAWVDHLIKEIENLKREKPKQAEG